MTDGYTSSDETVAASTQVPGKTSTPPPGMRPIAAPEPYDLSRINWALLAIVAIGVVLFAAAGLGYITAQPDDLNRIPGHNYGRGWLRYGIGGGSACFLAALIVTALRFQPPVADKPMPDPPPRHATSDEGRSHAVGVSDETGSAAG